MTFEMLLGVKGVKMNEKIKKKSIINELSRYWRSNNYRNSR